jgi:hypothetical protein
MKKWDLAKALAGDVSGKWINIPGPGHSHKDRTLGFLFDPKEPDGIRVHSLAGDDPIACRNYVIAKLQDLNVGGTQAIDEEPHLEPDPAHQARIKAALSLWDEAVPARGTVVEKYLATRGCLLPAPVSCGDVLRFHPHCTFGAARVPAMVVLMRDVVTGEPIGIHRTALKDDGSGKRIMPDDMPAKMMLGRAKGAVVMLQPHGPRLGIAEGIETALSASQIFGIPVWSLMSASGIAACPVIPGVKRLTIFADQDQAGLAAAAKCATRYERASIEGEIRYPSTGDWNSYLTETIHD